MEEKSQTGSRSFPATKWKVPLSCIATLCNSRLWAKLTELNVLRIKGKGKPKHNSTRVCLSAIEDILICAASWTETVGNTSQPTKDDGEESACQRSTLSLRYNTEMYCHIRCRCIGYYILGLYGFQHMAGLCAWQDWIPALFLSFPVHLLLSYSEEPFIQTEERWHWRVTNFLADSLERYKNVISSPAIPLLWWWEGRCLKG